MAHNDFQVRGGVRSVVKRWTSPCFGEDNAAMGNISRLFLSCGIWQRNGKEQRELPERKHKNRPAAATARAWPGWHILGMRRKCGETCFKCEFFISNPFSVVRAGSTESYPTTVETLDDQ